MNAERDRCRQRLSAFFGAAVELMHAPARVQRDAQSILAPQHQAVEARGVDPGNRIARGDLAGGDVRRGIDREVRGYRQFGEVDLVAFERDFLPRRILHDLAGDVFLATLAERRRQVGDLDAETGRQQFSVAGDVGHDGQRMALDVFIDHDGAPAGALELEHEGSHVEMGPHRRADAQELVWIIALNHGEETAQALAFVNHVSATSSPNGSSVPSPRCTARL